MAGQSRVMYVAKFEDAIYVLHCFKKKTQKTSQKDKDLSTQRYKDMLLTRSKNEHPTNHYPPQPC